MTPLHSSASESSSASASASCGSPGPSTILASTSQWLVEGRARKHRGTVVMFGLEVRVARRADRAARASGRSGRRSWQAWRPSPAPGDRSRLQLEALAGLKALLRGHHGRALPRLGRCARRAASRSTPGSATTLPTMTGLGWALAAAALLWWPSRPSRVFATLSIRSGGISVTTSRKASCSLCRGVMAAPLGARPAASPAPAARPVSSS